MSNRENDRSKIGKYVSQRRANPGIQQGLESIHDFERKLLRVKEECVQFGVDQELIHSACHPSGDLQENDRSHEDAVDELSLYLLEALIQQENMERAGVTHLVRIHRQIPNSLIDELALMMLEACSGEYTGPPQALTVLLRARMGRLGRSAFLPRKSEEKDLAALLLASDPSLSARKMAEIIGVEHTTVLRWLKEEEFRERVKAAPKITPTEGLIRVLKAFRDQD